MMTRGKRSSTATASIAQVKRPRAMASSTLGSCSQPARSAAPKRTFPRAGDQWAILSLNSRGLEFSCLSEFGFKHH